MKDEFDVAAVSAINKIFPDSRYYCLKFSFCSVPMKTTTKYWSYGGIQRK